MLPGALIIGGDHPGLGIARSLGQKGIPVYVIDDQHSVSAFSKYVQRFVKVADLLDEKRTIGALMDIGRRFDLKGWVLFPTRDESVAACSRYRAELAEIFKVTTPEWETVRWAWDKKNTYDLAERLNIPCPHTFTVGSADELPALYSKLPLAIKPAVKERFFYATGAKAWRANTVDELHDLFNKARKQIAAEEILIQEIIPGGGSQQFSYCAFFQDGRTHSSLVAQRLRQHPHEFGRAATYVETIELPEIEELSERFLKAIDYYGLVEIEFKLDPRDGRYKLLDVNARTWGFHWIGSAAGVDFPYLLYADQVGLPVNRCRGNPGVGWLRLLTDGPAALSDLLRGRIDARSYVESIRRTQVESVFCRRDPLPSLAEIILLPYYVSKKCL